MKCGTYIYGLRRMNPKDFTRNSKLENLYFGGGLSFCSMSVHFCDLVH